MTNEQRKRIHLIYGTLVSVVTVIAGICFIVSCVGIYTSGDDPYSREVVAEAFSRIAVPVYLCLGLVIGGFILNLALPLDKERIKAGRSDAFMLDLLHAKTDLSLSDDTLRESIEKEQKRRRLHLLISSALLAIGSAIFLAYALNFEHFHPTEMNASMISAMKLLIPCLAIPFAYIMFTTYYNMKSIRRELDLVKQANAGGAKKNTARPTKIADTNPPADDVETDSPSNDRSDKLIRTVRCALLIVGIGLIILGIATGGMADVLAKAINICTECIGLG